MVMRRKLLNLPDILEIVGIYTDLVNELDSITRYNALRFCIAGIGDIDLSQNKFLRKNFGRILYYTNDMAYCKKSMYTTAYIQPFNVVGVNFVGKYQLSIHFNLSFESAALAIMSITMKILNTDGYELTSIHKTIDVVPEDYIKYLSVYCRSFGDICIDSCKEIFDKLYEDLTSEVRLGLGFEQIRTDIKVAVSNKIDRKTNIMKHIFHTSWPMLNNIETAKLRKRKRSYGNRVLGMNI